MPDRVTVYSPDNEPFEVPVERANDLVLNQGWSQQPLDSNAEPLVQTVERPNREFDWGPDVGREIVEDEDEIIDDPEHDEEE